MSVTVAVARRQCDCPPFPPTPVRLLTSLTVVMTPVRLTVSDRINTRKRSYDTERRAVSLQ